MTPSFRRPFTITKRSFFCGDASVRCLGGFFRPVRGAKNAPLDKENAGMEEDHLYVDFRQNASRTAPGDGGDGITAEMTARNNGDQPSPCKGITTGYHFEAEPKPICF